MAEMERRAYQLYDALYRAARCLPAASTPLVVREEVEAALTAFRDLVGDELEEVPAPAPEPEPEPKVSSDWRLQVFWDETRLFFLPRWAWKVWAPKDNPYGHCGPFARGYSWTQDGASRRALDATPRRVYRT